MWERCTKNALVWFGAATRQPQARSGRQRARGNSIVSGIGRLFDLTAAIESSSLAPTETQQRSLEASVAEFTDIVAKLNEVITTKLPALSGAVGRNVPRGETVRPPI